MASNFVSFLLLSASLWLALPGFAAGSGDYAPYSLHPPGGVESKRVPQFVVIGFDDNGYSGLEGSAGDGGMKWVLDFFKDKKNPKRSLDRDAFAGKPCRASFYPAASYGAAETFEERGLVKKAWRRAWLEGHEIGNHTFSHSEGLKLNPREEVWIDEIRRCNAFLTAPYPETDGSPGSHGGGTGVDKRDICGFRTPYLAYTHETFAALCKEGFLYDCSIEDGWQKEQDGSNFCWPYTLDNGSPGDALIWNWPGVNRPRPIGAYPGLWELPLHPVVVPPDAECAHYNIPAGLRGKIEKNYPWFDEASGKLPAFDYNLFFVFKMNREEALAVLKYTFDLHYNGNRAPFSLGAHSDIYSSRYPLSGLTNYKDRQWVIEQFVGYILTRPDTRIVTARNVIEWCKSTSGPGVSFSRLEQDRRWLSVFWIAPFST